MLRSLGLGLLSALFIVCGIARVAAQTPALPSFEAASVKPNVSGDSRSGTQTMPGRIGIVNLPLRQIIRNAYGSQDIEVIGGPDWIGADRWDITAVVGAGTEDAAWRLMLRSLLAERFGLRAHIESRERPTYALVLARSDRQLGPALHPAKADIDCRAGDLCGSTTANTNGIVSGVITGTSRSMADIAESLSRYAERRVFDRTGLAGRFDFEVRWSDVPIFTAVQEQLGLKLQPDTGPVDVVVVDHVDRPTAD